MTIGTITSRVSVSLRTWTAVVGLAILVTSACQGRPPRLSIAVGDETLPAGGTTPVTISVQNPDGDYVAGVPVSLSTDTPGARVFPGRVVTDGRGLATVRFTLASRVGENRLRASVGEASAFASVDAVSGPAAALTASVAHDRLAVGGTTEIDVHVTDAHGNPVAGVPVSMRTLPDDATLELEESLTDASGRVAARLVVSADPGTNRVDIRVPGPHTASLAVEARALVAIAIQPEELRLASGTTESLKAVGLDGVGQALPIEVEWQVRGDVGEIDAWGRFTATTAGEGVVEASTAEHVVEIPIAVSPGEVATIAVSPPVAEATSGHEVVFEAVARDAAGNVVRVPPTWSLTSSLGTIDGTGRLAATTAGSADVVAAVGDVRGAAVVTVHPGPVATIALEPATATLSAGDTQQFTATALDAAGNRLEQGLAWRVTAPVGEVDGEGRLDARHAGEGEVVVSTGGVSAAAGVTVSAGPATSLAVETAPGPVPSGHSHAFRAIGRDDHGNEVEVSPDWQVTGEVGAIGDEGVFTGVRAGRGRVTATLDDLTGSAAVEVIPGAVARIELWPGDTTIAAGAIQQLAAVGFDLANNRPGVAPRWHVASGPGAVDARGAFSSPTSGESRVVVALGEMTADTVLTVVPAPLVRVEVTPTVTDLRSADEVAFEAVGRDVHGNAIAIEPAWAVTEGIGRIDATTGRFEATGTGAGAVVAAVGTISGLAEVRVSPGPLAGFEISSPPVLRPDEQYEFSAVARDVHRNAHPAVARWSVAGDIGRIDAHGRFTATRPGVGRVVASAGDVQTGRSVRVVAGPLDAIRVVTDRSEPTLPAGETMDLRVVSRDRDGNEVAVTPTWSLDGDVGTLSPEGRFVAHRAGRATIRAAVGVRTAAILIEVTPGPLAELSLVPSEVDVPSGATVHFRAYGRDAYGNAVDVEPAWSVSSGLGLIDAKGRLEATTVGRGKVRAVVGEVVGTASLETVPGTPRRLRISPGDVALTAGETQRFQAESLDDHGNVVERVDAEWLATGRAGTIDARTGLFTGVSTGETRVVATVDRLSGGTRVSVVPGPPSADTSGLQVTLGPAGDTATVVITARDAFSNPVPGVEVVVTSSGVDDVVSLDAGETDDEGRVTGRVDLAGDVPSLLQVQAGGVTLGSSELGSAD